MNIPKHWSDTHLKDLLDQACAFNVGQFHGMRNVKLERRDMNNDVWAITGENGLYVLTKDKAWIFEPSPSERDESFLQKARYTFREALLVLHWD